MKAMIRVLLIMVAWAFLFPVSARAEIRGRSMEVGFYAGYNNFEHSKNLNNAFLYGGRLGYNVNSHFGMEVGIEAMTTRVANKNLTGQMEGQFRSPMDQVDIDMYYINALYYFNPNSPINAFILAGVGGARYGPSISTGDMIAVTIGAGAKYQIQDRLALRIDLRDIVVSEGFQEAFHNMGVTAGLSYSFGGGAGSDPHSAAMVIPPDEGQPHLEGSQDGWTSYRALWFERGEEGVRSSNMETVSEIASYLRQNPTLHIALDTFMNPRSHDQHDRRVDAVHAALLQAGVPAERIEIGGYGDPNPRSNARVEVLITQSPRFTASRN